MAKQSFDQESVRKIIEMMKNQDILKDALWQLLASNEEIKKTTELLNTRDILERVQKQIDLLALSLSENLNEKKNEIVIKGLVDGIKNSVMTLLSYLESEEEQTVAPKKTELPKKTEIDKSEINIEWINPESLLEDFKHFVREIYKKTGKKLPLSGVLSDTIKTVKIPSEDGKAQSGRTYLKCVAIKMGLAKNYKEADVKVAEAMQILKDILVKQYENLDQISIAYEDAMENEDAMELTQIQMHIVGLLIKGDLSTKDLCKKLGKKARSSIVYTNLNLLFGLRMITKVEEGTGRRPTIWSLTKKDVNISLENITTPQKEEKKNRKKLKGLKINESKKNILYLLQEQKKLMTNVISEKLSKNISNIHQNLNKLSDYGYVNSKKIVRRGCPIVWKITKKGSDFLKNDVQSGSDQSQGHEEHVMSLSESSNIQSTLQQDVMSLFDSHDSQFILQQLLEELPDNTQKDELVSTLRDLVKKGYLLCDQSKKPCVWSLPQVAN